MVWGVCGQPLTQFWDLKGRFWRFFAHPTLGKVNFDPVLTRAPAMWVTWGDAQLDGLSEAVSSCLLQPIGKKFLFIKRPIFRNFTVFRIFQGHPLTLRDSKGHVCNLIFRDASNGTGRMRLGRREPQNTLNRTPFGKYRSLLPEARLQWRGPC